MRVTVDLAKCQGYANCISEAPRVFDLDADTNKSVVLVDAVPAESEAEVWNAEASCPVRAISVEE